MRRAERSRPVWICVKVFKSYCLTDSQKNRLIDMHTPLCGWSITKPTVLKWVHVKINAFLFAPSSRFATNFNFNLNFEKQTYLYSGEIVYEFYE